MNNNTKNYLIRMMTAIQVLSVIIIIFHLVGLFLLSGSGHEISEKKEFLFFRNIGGAFLIIVVLFFIKKNLNEK